MLSQSGLTVTVTFLFTDIEGSTRLWELHPETMKGVLARHDALLRQIIEARHRAGAVYTVQNLTAILTAFNSISLILSLVLVLVSAIALIISGIGIMNIMLVTVTERTREIGLRMALGATPGSIIAMIIQESLFITAVAGYSGLVVGTLLIQGIARLLEASGGSATFFSRPEVEFSTALLALAVLILSALLASLLPAAKAAAVNPILALQDE